MLGGKKKKILIIDDEEDFGKMVKMNLEDSGEYEVKAENKGQNGLNTVKKFKPDLILLDIMMPKIDGLNVLEDLKKDKATSSVPVVLLTAVKTDEIKLKAAQLYGEDYLEKPVTTQKLKDTIEEVLRRTSK